jgi:autotransporter strand-loop-strand O-heptosyltransferase
LVDELNSLGYKVVSISKEKSTLKNVIKRNGNYDLIDRSWYLHHCEFFIGVSSGLGWLAWACGKKVVMISGATQSWNEFQEDNIRIINKEVCHGCWNSEEHSDKFGCFHLSFCPENKNFECTRKISPQFVIDRIKEEGLIND